MQCDDRESETRALIERLQTDPESAFAEVYLRYRTEVFTYLRARVSDVTVAEDLTSETFLRALRAARRLTYQGRDIGAWLITVARNLFLDHIMSAHQRRCSTGQDLVDLGAMTTGIEDEVLDRCLAEQLRSAMADLAPAQRRCLELRFLLERSVAETAAAMGKQEHAVRQLQLRAVRRLSTLVQDETWHHPKGTNKETRR